MAPTDFGTLLQKSKKQVPPDDVALAKNLPSNPRKASCIPIFGDTIRLIDIPHWVFPLPGLFRFPKTHPHPFFEQTSRHRHLPPGDALFGKWREATGFFEKIGGADESDKYGTPHSGTYFATLRDETEKPLGTKELVVKR